ncbi:hypothetical protein [Pandoraea cepalis]|uniref:hypothetical protein n=1 Tax=Pandoraea cepalis TaxID=2508294 RepID=UPI00263AF2B3|nr:hypothetical protein [Pandoraea cepalis]
MNGLILKYGRFWARWAFIAWSMPIAVMAFGVWAGASVREVLSPAIPSFLIAALVTAGWLRLRVLKRNGSDV